MKNSIKIILFCVMVGFIGVMILFQLILKPKVTLNDFLQVILITAVLIFLYIIFTTRPEAKVFQRGLSIPMFKPEPPPTFKVKVQQNTSQSLKKVSPSSKVITSSEFTSKLPLLFGTAGIRGRINKEITPLLALKIAQVFGDYLENRGRVAVGYDTRYGSEMLAQAVASGLASTGISVVDCGCIPTGGLAAYITREKLSGGILITGSHTPYDMTGIIIIQADGSYLPEEIAREVENRFYQYDKRRVTILPESIGRYMRAEKKPLEVYKELLISLVNQKTISSRKFRVLVDPGNGTAGLVLPHILRDLGCEVYLVNETPSPVPNRAPEPRASHLAPTAEKVKEYQCDLGMALDTDADRVIFIDHTGEILSEDLVGAIFARAILTSEKLCVTPINSSGLIETVCSAIGARLEYCRIGAPATLKLIKQLRANFAYEESGKYYFAEEVLWADGILAGLKLLEILSQTHKSLSELAQEFPKFYQVKRSFPCEEQLKDTLMTKVLSLWQKELLEGKTKDIIIDGLKRIYEDNAWVLIRKSGTEPIIRIYADATNLARAEELAQKAEELVRRAASLVPGFKY